MVHDQARQGHHRRQAESTVHQRSPARSAWRRARVAVTPTRANYRLRRANLRRRARSTCPPTTSSGRSTKATGVAARPSSTRRSSTRVMARAAWPSSSRLGLRIVFGPPRKSARCSPRAGGQLACSGAVAWQFEPRGLISVPRNGVDQKFGRPHGDGAAARGRLHRSGGAAGAHRPRLDPGRRGQSLSASLHDRQRGVFGVKPSAEYIFAVIASPVGSYFKGGPAPVSIWVSELYTAPRSAAPAPSNAAAIMQRPCARRQKPSITAATRSCSSTRSSAATSRNSAA